MTYIPWSSDFALYLEDFDAWTLLFGIITVTYILWPSDFALYLWRLFDVGTSYFGIKGQYDLTFDLKINVGLCDLYFMVQWLCVISPRLFDAWVSYFQIMRQCDPNFDLKVNMSIWPIFHGLVILLNIFQDYLMDEHHSWYNGLVWHIDLTKYM